MLELIEYFKMPHNDGGVRHVPSFCTSTEARLLQRRKWDFYLSTAGANRALKELPNVAYSRHVQCTTKWAQPRTARRHIGLMALVMVLVMARGHDRQTTR
jgi:hypothetical protein